MTAGPLAWLLLSLLLFLVLPLGLRRVGLGDVDDGATARVSPRTVAAELGLPVVLGLALAAWWFTWLGAWALFPWPVLARDFAQVCDALLSVREGVASAYPQRSPVAAALPALLSAPLGIIDGLLVASTLSTAVVVGAVYCWTRTLAGHRAALAAVLLAGAIGPLASLPRHLQLYPELIAAFVLSAAGGAAALRWRSPLALAACGAGAGLALLVDGRGLLHALAALLCGLLALSSPGAARRLRGLLALLLPLLLSWLLASAWLPADTPALETQLSWYQNDGGVPLEPSFAHQPFLWGHSPPWQLPATLLWVLGGGGALAWPAVLRPWLLPLACALPLALYRLHRHPRRLVALLLTTAPFVAVLGTATHPRHVAWGAAALPVVIGLGVVALDGGARPAEGEGGRHRVVGSLALGALLLALVAGVLPSPISPEATWRSPVGETPDIDALVAAHPRVSPTANLPFADPRCRDALSAELDAGASWGGRLVGPWPVWQLPLEP